MPDRRRYVVLLGPHPASCDHARRAGLGVILVDSADKLSVDLLAQADCVLGIDYRDSSTVADLVRVLGRAVDVRGAQSLTEAGLLPAAEINEKLGFKDNSPEVVRRVVDKELMRDLLATDARFAVPAARVRSTAELRNFASEHGLPLVLKPHDGAGSVGVRMLRDPGEIDGWHADPARPPPMVEKYLEGKEFSVEAMSLDGVHLAVAITEKRLVGTHGTDHFVEIGHVVPASLDVAVEHGLREFVGAFLTAMGIREGLTHTEVILSPSGPAIVETHTRNGGDHIADLVLLSTGLDLRDLAVRATAALLHCLPPAPRIRGGAAIRYLHPSPGVVTGIRGALAARFMPGVVDLAVEVGVGDVIRPLRSSLDRVGYVIALGPDGPAAEQRCLDALALIEVSTSPV